MGRLGRRLTVPGRRDSRKAQADSTDTMAGEGGLDPLRPQRRPKMIGLGVALIALSALGGVALANSLAGSTAVLALANDVDRGQQIQASDLVTVQVANGETGLATIPADQADQVIGSIAASDLHAGSTLTQGQLGDTLGLSQGSSLVGVALSPSQAPGASLSDGDRVTLVQVAAAGSTTVESPQTWEGTVVSTHASAADSTVQIVDVEISQADAAQVASLAASDQIALVVDSQEG